MTTPTYSNSPTMWRWTQRAAASLLCVAAAGCGGGDSATATAPAATPQLLATASVSGSSAAQLSAASYHPVVHGLYVAFYGRPPDTQALTTYAARLAAIGGEPTLKALVQSYGRDAKVRALVDEFAASAEFKTLYGGTSSEQFVTMMFQTFLARNPEASGKAFWSNLVTTGALSRGLAVLTVMTSAAASDQLTIEKKVAASTKFTSALPANSGQFINDVIVNGRAVLNGVSKSTSEAAIDNSVAEAMEELVPPAPLPGNGASLPLDAITDIKFENTSTTAQSNLPVTFGQIFAPGHFARGEGLVGRTASGALIPMQVDVKASHADGSVRHAVVSAVLPTLAAREVLTVQLIKHSPAQTPVVAPVLPANFSSRIEITLDGVKYAADLADAMAGPAQLQWLSGPIAREGIYNVALKTASGVAHPHLTARYSVRTYANSSNPVRLDVVVENNYTFKPGARNYTYAVVVKVNGRDAYVHPTQPHYHHARWRKLLWGNPEAPAVHIRHNASYIIASKAVPNYDQRIVPNNKTLDSYAATTVSSRNGPMKIGPTYSSMHTTGGRPDIGPLPGWAVMYLLSMDRRAWDAMIAAADGSGSWSIHYRDENTGYPVRMDNPVNANISTHGNFTKKGPLPVPRCANDTWSLCDTPFANDTAHQPSLTYLPYLVTGDYFYLEEMQFWAAFNPTATAPGNHGFGKGLVRWMQVRGQAWALRTLGQVAYLTPDDDYLKGYFNTQVDNNLNFYHAAYVVGNPNALGVYDGSGEGSSGVTQSAPWQDDYFTWSFGYLAELGYAKAEPILQWKAKYSVGRMTAPGYCYVEAAAYWLKYRDNMSSPIYSSFAQLYAANFSDTNVIDSASKALTHPTGLSYTSLACGSQAQADWRTAATRTTWLAGQMTGYSTSEIGYPSNMQIALAVAANSGIPNAKLAWTTFINAPAKPDYSKGPQFAVIPR